MRRDQPSDDEQRRVLVDVVGEVLPRVAGRLIRRHWASRRSSSSVQLIVVEPVAAVVGGGRRGRAVAVGRRPGPCALRGPAPPAPVRPAGGPAGPPPAPGCGTRPRPSCCRPRRPPGRGRRRAARGRSTPAKRAPHRAARPCAERKRKSSGIDEQRQPDRPGGSTCRSGGCCGRARRRAGRRRTCRSGRFEADLLQDDRGRDDEGAERARRGPPAASSVPGRRAAPACSGAISPGWLELAALAGACSASRWQDCILAAMPLISRQTGPIAVYGATGYTGRLVVAELAAAEADFVLSGRNPRSSRRCGEELGSRRRARTARVDDPASLRALLARLRGRDRLRRALRPLRRAGAGGGGGDRHPLPRHHRRAALHEDGLRALRPGRRARPGWRWSPRWASTTCPAT